MHEATQDKNTFIMFEFIIGNTEYVEKMKCHSKDPMLKYCQNSLNNGCFSSLTSAFDCTNQSKAANAIAIHTEESLTSQVDNCIYFENAILKGKKSKDKQKVYYSLRKYKQI